MSETETTGNCQKIKLLELIEMLRRETDEQHPMTTSEICKRLSCMGITCDRRTLGIDMKLLNDRGYEIMTTMVGHKKGFYIEDRSFSIPEHKILIDAVQAASFITTRKTNDFIDKIAALGGNHCADILKSNLVCFNSRKHSNESIFYNIVSLEKAISEKRKVSFVYFDLDENGEHVYRKEKKRYIADPMALIFRDDNYYLMTHSEKYNNICNYRVDRMENVEIEDERVCREAIIESEHISEYTDRVFKMYGGKSIKAVLKFERELIGAFFDRFGEAAKIKKISDTEYIATVTVQVSPAFWGWLFQFAGQMEILAPDSLAKAYKERAELVSLN